jgi:hypothetical protein
MMLGLVRGSKMKIVNKEPLRRTRTGWKFKERKDVKKRKESAAERQRIMEKAVS